LTADRKKPYRSFPAVDSFVFQAAQWGRPPVRLRLSGLGGR
jgi:hypothetical protein